MPGITHIHDLVGQQAIRDLPPKRSPRAKLVIALAICSIALPGGASAQSPPATGSSDGKQAYSIRPQTGERLPVPDDTEAAAPQGHAPTTIDVVAPERTIVRDADDPLPLMLSGTALVLVLAGIGFLLVRARVVPRPGRSH